MEREGVSPNCFTLSSVVAACANLAGLSCGQQLHGGIVRRGFDGNLALANALIDMYAKCGNIVDSRKVFDEMSIRDKVGAPIQWVYGVLYVQVQHMKEAGYVLDLDCLIHDLEDGT
ncbi:tetratricopeptide repeat (TPR)-like superfamily protein [Actinidia rufa]|uniref:Tetratricopeptide repeat (TPR)-like superfamily protein n=1 Tax=Actinidia rufa TaxID=165716 RepID=A0A7J0G8W5_9ERIC|nr:tetratricopeptide repeat (TPR)-like superfamily protein [Actinidia rufa]